MCLTDPLKSHIQQLVSNGEYRRGASAEAAEFGAHLWKSSGAYANESDVTEPCTLSLDETCRRDEDARISIHGANPENVVRIYTSP